MKFSAISRRLMAAAAIITGVAMVTSCSARAGGGDEDPFKDADTLVIGTSMPMSGPSAIFGLYADGVEAYFNYVNDNGGVHGKKLELKVLDDGYEPARTVQNAKQLVERDNAFAIAFVVGTAHSLGIRDYLNQAGVPNVLANTGHSDYGDPEAVEKYPYSTAYLPAYELEALADAEYIKEHAPDAKVAILRANDDLGQSLYEGFVEAIEGTDIEIVGTQVFSQSDASVESQVQTLAQTDADVFLNWSSGTFTAQSITTMTKLGWDPTTFLISWNTAMQTLEPAGLQNSVGFLAPAYLKEPSDASWDGDEGMEMYREIIEKYGNGADVNHHNVAYGYNEAQIFVRALENAEEVTRDAFMESLRNMQDEEMDVLLPGILVTTDESAHDYFPISSLGFLEFDGAEWVDTGLVYHEN